MSNIFFKKHGPFEIDKLLNLSKTVNKKNFKKIKVTGINDLVNAKNNEISFFFSKIELCN